MDEPATFLGRIDVRPRLNQAEVSYLAAFATTRRWRRPSGPYSLEEHPGAESSGATLWNMPAQGQPGLTCCWAPEQDGGSLVWDGGVDAEPADWLRYLVRHFLGPSAAVASADRGPFRDFTGNHRLDGTVVGRRERDDELFAIRVTGNRVTRRVLHAAIDLEPERRARPPADDLWREQRAGSGGAVIIDLASRRG